MTAKWLKIKDMHKGTLDALYDCLRPLRERSLGRRPVRRSMVFKRAGNACQACAYPVLDVLNEHHILPLSKGGTSAIENPVSLCPNCHALVHLCIRCLAVDSSMEFLRQTLIDNGVQENAVDSILLLATEEAESTFDGAIVPRKTITQPSPPQTTEAGQKVAAMLDGIADNVFGSILNRGQIVGEISDNDGTGTTLRS